VVARRFRHLGLGVLLAVSLLVRLVWGLIQPVEIDARLPDQYEYLSLARSLLAGEGLRFFDARFSDDVYAYRTPGYPIFLVACGGSVRVARVVQAFLDTSTVLAGYLLARRWLPHGVGFLAGAIIAFNPFLIYFSALILSETLFTAMMAWGMVLLVWRANFLWGGALLAVSVLVRPGAVGLPIVLGVGAVFVMHHRGELRSSGLRIPVATTMLALVVAALAPWAMRNHERLGQWIWLTTNGGITRYDGFNQEATGASDQSFLGRPEMRRLKSMTEVERDEYLSGLANRWIAETWRTQPSRLVRLTLAKIGRTWSPIPLSAEFGSRSLYKIAAMAYTIPFDLLILIGAWSGRIPRRAAIFLLMPAVYFTIVHTLSVGSLRYRVPVEPALAVLAAAGWAFVRGAGNNGDVSRA
jgi:4-amino-4-deoxy-L-arabinose transferase-like glycosyltransferase